MKKYSIIIATYNAEKTLWNCLDSIRVQKEDDVELLIIDGNSADATKDIISQNKDIIDFYVSESDRGIYDAWNKGIKKANGEWILFLGADDLLLPGALDRYRLFLSENSDGYEYISARVRYLDEKGDLIKIIGRGWSWKSFQKKMTVAHVASLHNRTLFDEVGLFDINYRICADYEFLLRKRDRLKAAFLPHVVAAMRMGGVSFSSDAIQETCRILFLYIPHNKLEKLFILLRKYFEFYFFRFRRSLCSFC